MFAVVMVEAFIASENTAVTGALTATPVAFAAGVRDVIVGPVVSWPQMTFASAQSAWSQPAPSPPSVTIRANSFLPAMFVRFHALRR